MTGQVRAATKTTAVFETLRSRIISGALPSGTPLRQDSIAEEFKVSSTPVREALRMLEAEALVSHSPHQGFVVQAQIYDTNDIAMSLQARIALESEILRLAPLESTILAELRRTIETAQEGIRKGDTLSVRLANRAFHVVIGSSLEAPTVSAALRLLLDRTTSFNVVDDWDYLSDRFADIAERHRRIAAALEAGNRDTAIAELSAHMRTNIAALDRFAIAQKEKE